jgi:hypothetical protein
MSIIAASSDFEEFAIKVVESMENYPSTLTPLTQIIYQMEGN